VTPPTPSPAPLETRYLSERALGALGPALLRFLLERGADEFTIRVMALQETPAPFADAFEDELGPDERESAARAVMASTAAAPRPRSVRLWSLNIRTLERLLSFLDDGLFHCPPGPDGWLEDLTVYRRAELVFGALSHERDGVLRLTRAEHEALAAIGIRSAAAPEG
jgi:hypothetical protein